VKSVLLSLLILSLSSASASAQNSAPIDTTFLIDVGRVGNLRLGASVDEVYRAFSPSNIKLIALFPEGHFLPALEIYVPPGSYARSIVAHIHSTHCGLRIVSAVVEDRRFRTKAGVGVGSTVADVRRAYRVTLSNEEGQHLIARDRHMGFESRDDLRKPSAIIDVIYLSVMPPPADKQCEQWSTTPRVSGFRSTGQQ
jgi:hypothetical protein